MLGVSPLFLLAVLIPPLSVLAVWHFRGYYNGRYDRWSAETIAKRTAAYTPARRL